MKKLAILMLLTVLSFNSYSQIKFKKGYFINNNNEKTECLIKNVDWGENPTKFEYKINDDSELNSQGIENVKEFGVDGFSVHKRFTVRFDSSSDITSNLDYHREPEFGKDETVFLRELVKGKASLYFYMSKSGHLKRYFYTANQSEIKQLTYKRYLKAGETGDQIVVNNSYKQELWSVLECAKLTVKDAEELSYKKNTLIKYFIKYNQCKGGGFVRRKDAKRKAFNVSLRVGLTNASVSVENSILDAEYSKIDFETKLNPRLALEIEYIFPYSKNKWALVFEPNYQKYEGREERSSGGVPLLVDMKYKAIEIPLGIRYYFLNKGNSRLFINAIYVVNIPLEDSNLVFTNATTNNIANDFKMEKNSRGVVMGLGYSLKNRLSFETRYQLKNDLLSQYLTWKANYNTLSFILGFRFL